MEVQLIGREGGVKGRLGGFWWRCQTFPTLYILDVLNNARRIFKLHLVST
jgi:hypothetical protein